MPHPPPKRIDNAANRLFNFTLRPFNGILGILFDPCAKPAWLYIETALEPAAETILDFFTAGALEITRAQLGAKYKNKGGCRGRRGGRKRGKGIPDPGATIGEFLAGEGEKQDVSKFGKGKKQAFRLDGATWRGAYYLALFESAGDFLMKWQSALFKIDMDEACSPGGAVMSGLPVTPPGPAGWHWIDFTQDRYTYGLGLMGVGWVGVNGWSSHVVACAKFHNFGPGPTDITVGLFEGTGTSTYIDGPVHVHLSKGETKEVTLKGYVKPGRVGNMSWFGTAWYVEVKDGFLACQAAAPH